MLNDYALLLVFIFVVLVVGTVGFAVQSAIDGSNMRACVQSGMQWKENNNHKMGCVK